MRSRLFRYSKDISELSDEVKLCQQDLQDDGECVHYAVDTNVLFLGVTPRKSSKFGQVFFDDNIHEERILALSLRRFLFETIASFERPLLISHGHDAEARWAFERLFLDGVHEQMELEEELKDISLDLVARLRNTSDPVAVFEKFLPKLTQLLAYDDGPGQDYRRFSEIVESGRVQRMSLAFAKSKFFTRLMSKNPSLRTKFSVPNTIKDQLAESRYRGEWTRRLNDTGIYKQKYALRCDVAALARIQLINERLADTGHRVALITADNTIITACQSLVFEDETTFRDRFIRHPKAFLAAQSVIVPDPDLVLVD